MPDPSPSPGLPNPKDALRAVQLVRSASRSTEGIVTIVSLLTAMPRDSRYRMSGWCRIGLPLLFVGMVLNYLFWNLLPSIPGLSLLAAIAERVILMGMGISGYVILRHELSRYRAVLDYIAAYGQPSA